MTTNPKCDGNHGGPRCADPECWNDTPAVADHTLVGELRTRAKTAEPDMAHILLSAAEWIDVLTKELNQSAADVDDYCGCFSPSGERMKRSWCAFHASQ